MLHADMTLCELYTEYTVGSFSTDTVDVGAASIKGHRDSLEALAA